MHAVRPRRTPGNVPERTDSAPVHRARGRRAGAEWLCREHREGGQAAAVPTVVATDALGGLPARNRSGATDDRRGAGLAAPPQSVRTVFGAHAAKAYGRAGRRGRSTGARATAGRWGVMGLAMCPFQLTGEDIGSSRRGNQGSLSGLPSSSLSCTRNQWARYASSSKKSEFPLAQA
jgi:hypothetical protein